MKLRELSALDPAVQRFLFEHANPTSFRHDYTPLDGLNYIVGRCVNDGAKIVGDLDAEFLFYAEQRNPKVLEPHIIGDGTKLREAARQGMGIARALGYERMIIWTLDERLVRIAEKSGFRLCGRIPGLHLQAEKLQDVFVLEMELTCDTLLRC
jgi:hypothetical protein